MSGHTVVKLTSDAAEVSPPASGSPFNLRRNLKKRKLDQDEPEQHEFKLIRPKERVAAKSYDMRRPVRPIDRQKMRPWLKNLLDNNSVYGLNWVRRDDGIFQISWRHASRLGWNLETDGDVFERWARHTGIFKDGDEPEPKRWKANFRCALHSLPDVKELTSPTDRKGRHASRTYRFLRPNEVQPPVKRKQRYNIQIPYGMYENHGSDDSGSQQADSDDRNTDEEAVIPDQIQAFPHCDHDYALRFEKVQGDQMSSDVSRNSSGYVLIKSKDTHAIEFRLTPQQSALQASGNKKAASSSKSASPQKKGKGNKKKTPSGGSSVKKAKGKVGQKNISLKKDGKTTKKVKKGNEKSGESSSSAKVSLKALLSGRKNAAGSKKAKGGQASSLASKKTKKDKKTAGSGAKKNKTERTDSRTSSPVQSQGLEALWEAATQIEKMDTLTCAPPTAPTSTPSRAIPKRAARTKVVSAPPSQKPTTPRSKPVTTSQLIVPSVATPIVLAAHPVVGTRTTFTPIPVLASVPAAGAPTALPTQVSLEMLQKFLGLSTVPGLPASTMPMTLVPGQVLANPKAEVKKPILKPADQRPPQVAVEQSGPSRKKGKAAASSEKVEKLSKVPAVHTPVTQPEGTSMLKHLLRLTGPAMAVSTLPPTIPTITTTTTSPRTIPIQPLIPSPYSGQIKAEVSVNESIAAVQAAVMKQETVDEPACPAAGAGEESSVDPSEQDTQNHHMLVPGQEAVSLQEVPPVVADNRTAMAVQDNSSQGLVKPETMETEVSEGCSDRVSNVSSVYMSSISSPVVQATGGLQSSDGVQSSAAPPHMLAPSPLCFTQAPVPTLLPTSAVPQVTLCLPPALLGPQTQQVSGEGTQTVTVTLPQSSVSGIQGQEGSVATFTHSLDLMQLLNLCAASGNGQLIIKTEPPQFTDPCSESSAQSFGQATTSQVSGGASTVPNYIVVETCQEAASAQSAVVSSSQAVMSDGQTFVSAVPTGALSAVASPALPLAVGSSTLLNSIDSTMLAAAVDTSALPAVQSSVLSTSVNCPVLSTAETQPDFATAFTDPQSVSVTATQEMMQAGINLTSDHDMASSQFEGNIDALSADQQGADSFIVEDMLL
ncbi:hypothetical protein ACOMHN_021977 [Nucella lapillus]